jgi:RNA polymerase sigma-70 factor (ECF subfamily)
LPNSEPSLGHDRTVRPDFDPAADLALVRGYLAGVESTRVQIQECLDNVSRILAAQNARLGRPLRAEDLADVAQDVSVLVLRKLPSYAGRAPLAGWIYRLCCLELMNAIRRKARHRRRFVPAPDVQEAIDAGGRRAMDAWLERDELLRAIERVGGVEADLLVLKHFEDLTFTDIARLLGMSANTVKTRYYRGLAQLEQIVKPNPGLHREREHTTERDGKGDERGVG